MSEGNEDLREVGNLRELDPDVEQVHVATAMMFVFPRFRSGLIQPKSSHKMVEYKGERCLAIAVKMDNPMSDFQLGLLRGAYPDWFFYQEGELVYVGIPMNTILAASENIGAQAMSEFGNYDQEREAERIVDALLRDFNNKPLALDLSSLGESGAS